MTKNILKIITFLLTLLISHFSYGEDHITLSLNEAILLAVRQNPNVQSTKLNYISQKFNLYIQKWAFYPHYSFNANATTGRMTRQGKPLSSSHNVNIQPGVSLLTPIGTNITLNMTNPETNNYNPTLSLNIVQPLMRGFGRAIVEAAENNAKDSEVIARLNLEGVLQTTVTNVINAYLDIVSASGTVKIDEDAVKRAEQSVKQTKLYIKAGHKAGNELVTVEANVASAKSQLENDKNQLQQMQYSLLTAIGLDPNTNVTFISVHIPELIHKYHLPPLDLTKKLVLEKDIQYQIDQITLHGSTTRSLLIAEDNTRWQLNLEANAGTGSGSGGGQNAGFNSLYNGANTSHSIALSLSIPIDDQTRKQGVLNAKIALKQAELALLQEKWMKETGGINGWNSVLSAERAFRYAKDAEKLQLQTYNVSYQKYLHGLIDSLELQSAQVQLTQAQQTLLNAQILYLKSLVNLDLLIGNTLNTWNIQTRLS